MLNGAHVDVRERLSSQGVGDDTLKLLECNHRTANALAAAVSALRLAANAPDEELRDSVLSAAVRLEAFAEVHSLLAFARCDQLRLSDVLERLCLGMIRAYLDHARVTVCLHECPVVVPGVTAHRLACVIAELLGNAARHGVGEDGGHVDILCSGTGGSVVIVMEERPIGPRRQGTPGTGLGRPIADELVRRLGGTIEFTSGPDCSRTELRIPGSRGSEFPQQRQPSGRA